MADAEKNEFKDRWIDVLLAMHNYNDASGKHHDESVRRSASIFILVYFFLLGVITTSGLNIISLFAAIFLTIFAKVGYKLTLMHSQIAGMHYWRNQELRNQLDDIRGNNAASLASIYEKSRVAYSEGVIDMGGAWNYGYGNHRKSWASIHRIFIVVGIVISIFAVVNQLSCFGKSGCLWSKGNDVTESVSGPIKELIRKYFART